MSTLDQDDLDAIEALIAARERTPPDYPTAVTYRLTAPIGAIDTITWASGKVWTYAYSGTQMTGISEA